MKKYKYILANTIEDYDNWNIEATFPAVVNGYDDYIIISKIENKVEEYQPKLKEATTDELLKELEKRLRGNK